jgi:hypothetical protein
MFPVASTATLETCPRGALIAGTVFGNAKSVPATVMITCAEMQLEQRTPTRTRAMDIALFKSLLGDEANYT